MKKVLISAVALVAFAMTANAQLFFGGQLGLSTSGGTSEWTKGNTTIKTDNLKTTSFTFAPQVGFFLSESFAVGGYLNLGITNQDNVGGTYNESKETTFGITPFARYYFINSGKWKVAAEGQLGFSLGHTTAKDGSGNIVSEPKTTTIAFNVRPLVAYSLTDNIDLQAGLNVLGLGFTHKTVKNEVGNTTATDKTNNFGLSANSNNIVSVGAITVGFIYKL